MQNEIINERTQPGSILLLQIHLARIEVYLPLIYLRMMQPVVFVSSLRSEDSVQYYVLPISPIL